MPTVGKLMVDFHIDFFLSRWALFIVYSSVKEISASTLFPLKWENIGMKIRILSNVFRLCYFIISNL